MTPKNDKIQFYNNKSAAKCPANPESADTFAGESSPVFGKLYLPSMKKDETFTLKKEAVSFYRTFFF